MMIALLESLSGKLGTIEICPNGHNRQGLVKFRSLCERRAQGVGGRNWKAVEGGRCPLLLHNWFPLEWSSLLHSPRATTTLLKMRLNLFSSIWLPCMGKVTMVMFVIKLMLGHLILGLRYLASYLLKPDRSNLLSCNKIQFRFWSTRRSPIPSPLISVQYFWRQLDIVFVRWKIVRPKKLLQMIDLSSRQYLSRWLRLTWTEEPCEATNVKKKLPVCLGWGREDLGWLYKVFYGRH